MENEILKAARVAKEAEAEALRADALVESLQKQLSDAKVDRSVAWDNFRSARDALGKACGISVGI